MKDYFDKLKKVELFSGIDNDLEKILNCIETERKIYKKSSFIYLAGDPIKSIGIILSGKVRIIREDSFGNSAIIAILHEHQIFGEVFVCAGIKNIQVTVEAEADCDILFIDYKTTMSSCIMNCSFHLRLIENLLELIAKKNLMLNQKIEIISKKTIREKLFAFFEVQKNLNGRKRFSIEFDRASLADYLCIDRSALSRELSKMQDEGLISFYKNSFEIKL